VNAREFLLAVRHQAEVATRGPWEASGNYVGTAWSGAQDWSGPIDDRELVAQASEGDAEFIAAARTNVPSLVEFALSVLDLADEFQSHHEQPSFTGNYDLDTSAAATWYEAEGRLRTLIDTLLARGENNQ
jgi:hypothetical protein